MKGWLNLITFLMFGTQRLSGIALWWLTGWEGTRKEIYRVPPSHSSYPALQQQASSRSCTAPRAGFKKYLHHAQKSEPRQSRWLWLSTDQPLNGRRYNFGLLWWTPLNEATEKPGGVSLPAAHISCVTQGCLGKLLRGELQAWLFLFPKHPMTATTAHVTQPLRATGGTPCLGAASPSQQPAPWLQVTGIASHPPGLLHAKHIVAWGLHLSSVLWKGCRPLPGT